MDGIKNDHKMMRKRCCKRDEETCAVEKYIDEQNQIVGLLNHVSLHFAMRKL